MPPRSLLVGILNQRGTMLKKSIRPFISPSLFSYSTVISVRVQQLDTYVNEHEDEKEELWAYVDNELNWDPFRYVSLCKRSGRRALITGQGRYVHLMGYLCIKGGIFGKERSRWVAFLLGCACKRPCTWKALIRHQLQPRTGGGEQPGPRGLLRHFQKRSISSRRSPILRLNMQVGDAKVRLVPRLSTCSTWSRPTSSCSGSSRHHPLLSLKPPDEASKENGTSCVVAVTF